MAKFFFVILSICFSQVAKANPYENLSFKLMTTLTVGEKAKLEDLIASNIKIKATKTSFDLFDSRFTMPFPAKNFERLILRRFKLTYSELLYIRASFLNLTNKELGTYIGKEKPLTKRTVDSHYSNIYKKLKFKSKEQLVNYIMLLGAFDLTPIFICLPNIGEFKLGPREQEVLEWVAIGLSDADIASKMNIAKGTVQVYITKISREVARNYPPNINKLNRIHLALAFYAQNFKSIFDNRVEIIPQEVEDYYAFFLKSVENWAGEKTAKMAAKDTLRNLSSDSFKVDLELLAY